MPDLDPERPNADVLRALSPPSEPKTNLGTKGFTLAQRSRVQPIVVGKS